MEHTLSIHDSSVPSQGAAPEPFELPSSSSSYDTTYEQPQQSYDAPVPLHAYSNNDAPVDVEDGWVQEDPVVDEPDIPTGHVEEPSGGDAMRRIVLRMATDETVLIGTAVEQEEAVAFAKDAVKRIAEAEAAGEWPEFNGRFVRCDNLVSVDIQVPY